VGEARAPKGRKNLNNPSWYSRAHLYLLCCLGCLGESVRTPASENLHCHDYYFFFFVVFVGVFFFGGFFLPGPLCGMSLLLSPRLPVLYKPNSQHQTCHARV